MRANLSATLSDSTKPRRWTVIGSGLLCGILALVVLFTDRGAFSSPLAVVVVAAIGMAAVLLQLRMRNKEQSPAVRPPVWLNVVGIVLALGALFSDLLHLISGATQVAALGAVGSFAISSALILHSFRKQRTASK
jgi:O-antigen/teichoic acid export membrane protein